MIKNNISILIIDDENDICEMVSIILKDEGYKTKIANNLDEAINIIQNENESYPRLHGMALTMPTRLHCSLPNSSQQEATLDHCRPDIVLSRFQRPDQR